MKLRIITVGRPKLAYAKAGWDEYFKRLAHYHDIRVVHVADKYAYDADYLTKLTESTYTVALVIDGPQFTSVELAHFLQKRAIEGRTISLMIGGPEGLPQAVIDAADYTLGLSKLTFPHDLAMVILLEALYRASTINAGVPYHK